MPYQVDTPPTVEPVTVLEVKEQAIIQTADDDKYLKSLIIRSRYAVENFLRMALIQRVMSHYQSSFTDVIELPRPPLLAVTEIRYTDENGAEQVLDPSVYTVDTKSTPGRVLRVSGQSWPSISTDDPNAVRVVYSAGYGTKSTDIPDDILQAILISITWFYEEREGEAEGDLPKQAKDMLWNYRELKF